MKESLYSYHHIFLDIPSDTQCIVETEGAIVKGEANVSRIESPTLQSAGGSVSNRTPN